MRIRIETKAGYYLAALLFVTGIVIWITLWQMGTAALLTSIVMVTGSFVITLIQRYSNKIAELRIVSEPQNPKRQIIISVNDNGSMEITSEGIPFNDVVAILEVSKYQMISQFTRGGDPMEITRRK